MGRATTSFAPPPPPPPPPQGFLLRELVDLKRLVMFYSVAVSWKTCLSAFFRLASLARPTLPALTYLLRPARLARTSSHWVLDKATGKAPAWRSCLAASVIMISPRQVSYVPYLPYFFFAADDGYHARHYLHRPPRLYSGRFSSSLRPDQDWSAAEWNVTDANFPSNLPYQAVFCHRWYH